ncbi:MAG: SMP-30/gluconolactonase/LRE family protein [Planctomycetaceae bacterium]|nr:SMP-30/gluconolactonase/LRE family protein [Planctomycetaceae bacterium]
MNVHPVFHSIGCLLSTLIATVLFAQDTNPKIEPLGEFELVQDGFTFTEGPTWDSASGALYFTDIPNTTIHRLDRNDQLSAFTTDSKHANGLMVAADGRLFACQMDGQVVAYDQKTKKAKLLVSQHNGKRFNAPNDLVLDKAGGLYFTDPLFRAPTPLPQEVQAVYYLSKNGQVTRVTEGLAAPNGIGLSPDGKQLYVIPSRQAEMLVYDVVGAGKLSNGRTLCQLKQPEGKSGTGGDGMALDTEGNLYITTNLGVEIISPAGEHRGLVVFPQQPANVTFGGEDRKTMYVTARSALYRIRMPIAGLPSN